MDFTKPQSTFSINGFPLTFRTIKLVDGQTVWVPRGLSRNETAKCWRLYLASEEGVHAFNISDRNHGGSPLASLQAAFEDMQAILAGVTSRYVVDRRTRPEGIERDPLVDCGVTGVQITRATRKDYKTIPVMADIAVQEASGTVKHTHYYAGSISERAEDTDPKAQQRKFHKLLRKAIAVRRYYNHLRSQGTYPTALIHYDDVPEEIRQQPVDLPKHIDVVEIMDSFAAAPWTRVVRTTGGDPEALAVTLLSHDLTKPHKLIYLNGFSLRFREQNVEGRKFYLPKELYRARGEWRIRIFHAEGIFMDAVGDDECGFDPDRALMEAWCYLISELRQHQAPEAGIRRPAKNPLLETGIRAVNIMGYGRATKTTGDVRWSFSLGFQQDEGSGHQRRSVIATWPLSTVTDEQILEGLRHAAAMSDYHYHLLDAGASPEEAALSRTSKIPAEFWPDKAPCPISVDDLRYFAEQREGSG